MTTTTEQLAEALRIAVAHFDYIACRPTDDPQERALVGYNAAREALARYDAERADDAGPADAANARSIAHDWLSRTIGSDEFQSCEDVAVTIDVDGDAWVPVRVLVSNADLDAYPAAK